MKDNNANKTVGFEIVKEPTSKIERFLVWLNDFLDKADKAIDDVDKATDGPMDKIHQAKEKISSWIFDRNPIAATLLFLGLILLFAVGFGVIDHLKTSKVSADPTNPLAETIFESPSADPSVQQSPAVSANQAAAQRSKKGSNRPVPKGLGLREGSYSGTIEIEPHG